MVFLLTRFVPDFDFAKVFTAWYRAAASCRRLRRHRRRPWSPEASFMPGRAICGAGGLRPPRRFMVPAGLRPASHQTSSRKAIRELCRSWVRGKRKPMGCARRPSGAEEGELFVAPAGFARLAPNFKVAAQNTPARAKD